MPAARLQKLLADAGLCSRRHAETLIAQGRVTIDGATAVLGQSADPALQRILIDGRPLPPPQPALTFLADKPRGVICTARDPQGRPTLLRWARANGLPPGRFFTVGRLDFDTEGLILLTTDGPLAQRLAHLSHHVEKEYRVWIPRPLSPAQAQAILRGVEDGPDLLRALAVIPERPFRPDWPPSIRLTLGEGRNRHIRRLLSALRIPILRLRRIRIGPLTESLLRHRPLLPLPPSRLPF